LNQEEVYTVLEGTSAASSSFREKRSNDWRKSRRRLIHPVWPAFRGLEEDAAAEGKPKVIEYFLSLMSGLTVVLLDGAPSDGNIAKNLRKKTV
jgi:hypothetical protein